MSPVFVGNIHKSIYHRALLHGVSRFLQRLDYIFVVATLCIWKLVAYCKNRCCKISLENSVESSTIWMSTHRRRPLEFKQIIQTLSWLMLFFILLFLFHSNIYIFFEFVWYDLLVSVGKGITLSLY